MLRLFHELLVHLLVVLQLLLMALLKVVLFLLYQPLLFMLVRAMMRHGRDILSPEHGTLAARAYMLDCHCSRRAVKRQPLWNRSSY